MSELMTPAAWLGAWWLRGLLPLAMWTLAVLAVVSIADHLLARWVRASRRLILYAVVALRAMVPAGLATPLGLVERGRSGLPGIAGRVIPESSVAALSTAHALAAARAAAAQTVAVARSVGSPWGVGAALAYLAVAGALAGVLVRRRRQVAAALASAISADPLAWPPSSHPLVVHETLGPLVAGVERVRIVMPAGLRARCSPAVLRDVIDHEAAHIERRDPVLLLAVQFFCVLLWPLPAVWLAARRVRQLMEVACDETVLEGRGLAARRRYARTLLKVADLGWAPTASLGFGVGLAARLREIRFTRRWPRFAETALVATAGLVIVAVAGVRAEARPPVRRPAIAADSAPASRPVRCTIDPKELDEYLDLIDSMKGSDPARAKLERELVVCTLAGRPTDCTKSEDPLCGLTKAHQRYCDALADYLRLVPGTPDRHAVLSRGARLCGPAWVGWAVGRLTDGCDGSYDPLCGLH